MSFELILPFLPPDRAVAGWTRTISEIMGNPDASWWYERDGIIHREAAVAFDAGRLRTGLEVIAKSAWKKGSMKTTLSCTRSSPDGKPPCGGHPAGRCVPDPAVVIRKFTSPPFTPSKI